MSQFNSLSPLILWNLSTYQHLFCVFSLKYLFNIGSLGSSSRGCITSLYQFPPFEPLDSLKVVEIGYFPKKLCRTYDMVHIAYQWLNYSLLNLFFLGCLTTTSRTPINPSIFEFWHSNSSTYSSIISFARIQSNWDIKLKWFQSILS